MVDSWSASQLVDCAVSLVSLCSCVALLWRLRRLPAAVRGRLFPTQVLWLSVADIGYTSAKLLIEQLHLCHHMWLIMLTTNISYLIETFLCLSFAFQAAKWSRGLQLLRWSGVLSLVLGGLVVLGEPWWNFAANPDFSFCLIIDAATIDVAFVASTCACLAISFGSFMFVLCQDLASSDAVHRRVVVRSTAYMLKTVIIVLPIVIALLLLFTLGPQPAVIAFADVANVLQDLNGFTNAATYFFLSRYSRRTVIDRNAVVEESFHVAFDAEIGVKLFDGRSTSSTSLGEAC